MTFALISGRPLRRHTICLPLVIIAFLLAVFVVTSACNASKALDDEAAIEIRPTDISSTVSPYLFGSNIRWLRNADGAWDQKHNVVNDKVLNALLNLKPTVMRYPGGSEANRYDWKAGVGPINSRRMLIGIDDKGINYFGTDEFLELCKLAGAEPIITVNSTTLSAHDAAEWVKYINLGNKSDTPKVRFWEIGNEPDWNGLTSYEYAKKVNLFADAMKTVDPTIMIGAAVSDRSGLGALKWDSNLFISAGKHIDFVIPHFYSTFNFGWAFYSNQTKSIEVNVNADGEYMIELIAKGTSADGVWPLIVITADRTAADKLTVDSSSWHKYMLPVKLRAGKNTISISYVNDLVSKRGEDRNCFIYDMIIRKENDVIYQLFSDENLNKAVFGTIREHESRIDKLKLLLKMASPVRPVKIAITEYNIIYNGTAPAGNRPRFDETSNLRSALFVGDMLSLFMKEDIWMANFWALMGGMGNLQVSENNIYYRPSYYVLKILRQHAGRELCSCSVNVGTMDSVEIDNFPAYNAIPLLGVVSTVDRSGKIIASVINRSATRDISSSVWIDGSVASYLLKATVLTGESMEADGRNQGEISYYSTDSAKSTNNFKYLFPKHSIVQLELTPQAAK